MLYVDQAIGQFWKRLAVITAANDDHAERDARVFNMTTPHCNDGD